MAPRPTELQFYEHRVTCAYCRANIMITSLVEIIRAARRTSTVCKRGMLIDDGKAVKMLGESGKKPPKQIRSRISKPNK